MIEVRKLTQKGTELFKSWLENRTGLLPPSELISDNDFTEIVDEIKIDPDRCFNTRYEFGRYLNEVLSPLDFKYLLNEANDGIWAWLAAVYFSQLSERRINRAEHYVVERKGPMGSLAYRQAARTCYELVYIHGEKAKVCLGVPMHTFGDMAEQLASRQNVARHRGFFEVAFSLYLQGDKLRRGASSKPAKVSKRKPGDRTGFGGSRRLALALRRLDLTFDTEIMRSESLIEVLPKEFKKWTTVTM